MSDKYEKVKSSILIAIQQNQPAPIDANIVIEAADRDDLVFLQRLQVYQLLRINIRIYDELVGLSKYSDLRPKTKRTTSDFLKTVQGRLDYTPPSSQTIRALNSLVPLIPREIAKYAVTKFIDSLLEKYELLKKGAANLTQRELTIISNAYPKNLGPLKSGCEERYLELVDQLNMPEFDEEAYFNDVNNRLNEYWKDINNVKEKYGDNLAGNIQNITIDLEFIKQKMHTTDVSFVAWAIEQGMQPFSMDSDVEWLFTFHGLKN